MFLMTFMDAIILGLVQGVTEFIPVSSSGHLVLVSHFLSISNNFTFDVLLNFGTLLALVIHYRLRIWSLITQSFLGKEWGLLAKLIGATVPAATVGVLFSNNIEKLNSYIWVVIAMLLVVGVLMVVKGNEVNKSNDQKIEKSITTPISLKIGFAQAFALIPGVSRSGVTLLMGINSKLSAAKAAEFSFLLAIPIIAGASLRTLFSNAGQTFVKDHLAMILIGNIVSFAAGMVAINFLIKLIGKRGLKDFGYYRICLATVLTLLVITGII